MSFFKPNYNKPGPGVPKNAPRKKGFMRFFEILARDFSSLLKLNLICCVVFAPAQVVFSLAFHFSLLANIFVTIALFLLAFALSIPIGANLTTCYHLICKMLQDDPGFFWHDYKEGFKKNFKSSLVPGMFFAALLAAQSFLFFSEFSKTGGTFNVIVLTVSFLLLFMCYPYFFIQSAYIDLGIIALLKNSMLLALGNAPKSLMSSVLGGGLLVLQRMFFPLALPITVFVGYSFSFILNAMWVWPIIDKQFSIEKIRKERQAEKISESIAEQNAQINNKTLE